MSLAAPFLDLKSAVAELRDELDAAWHRVLDSGWFLLGPELDAFEAEFAAYCGVAHSIGVGNGLDALTLILRAYDIGPGDEVIVPAHTFIATWLAVRAAGASPVAVEPSRATMNIDPEWIAPAISPRTRAILPVHLYGQPAEMTAIRALADQHGLKLIEDAAQAHGARWRGRRTGGLGDAAAFSFYPGKNLGAFGDGGAILTNDDALAEKVRKLRNYGSARKYQHDLAGVNSRLDELQAALLRVRLRHLDAWNARRAAVAAHYNGAFAALDGVEPPTIIPGAEPVWHLYVLRTAQRDALIEHLDRHGIQTQIHYPTPCYRQPPFCDSSPNARTVTDRLVRSIVSLPIGPHVSTDQVVAVTAAVESFLVDR